MNGDNRLAGIRLQSMGSSTEKSIDFQEQKLQSLQEASECLLPEGFISKVSPPMFRDHKSYVFILYCLNHVDLVTDLQDSTKCHYPLQIFKDCKLGSLVQRDFAHYFQFSQHGENNDYSDIDTTLVNLANMRDPLNNSHLLKMTIVPRVCSFDKRNSKTYKLVLEYLNRFETVLTKFRPQKNFTKIYFNWLKLVESFTELVFRDLLIKWQQWLELTMNDTTVKLNIPFLLRKFVTQLWQKHFTFQSSMNSSVDSFTELLLSKNSISLLDLPQKTREYKLNFGLWFDCQNGILIFTNGIVRMSDEIIDERLKSFVRPAHVLVLEDHPSDEIVKKLVFFIFSAILQCFTDEILEC
ncbi:hypothetical protein SEUBUCD650_0O00620 [Saccharomyces eubayanus]|uniref:NDJ1-like protein n=1 Tax=Saccharomyces eubayanus TaxID=1080349 RepID=A0ABN8VK00_SACEU|nr:hypothetical protein SEUBUCD650_0O00620 [Saccharomyces eubayanus]